MIGLCWPLNDQIGSLGDEVIVTGYDLGMSTAGGFSVASSVIEQLVPRPPGLSLHAVMAIDATGFMTPQCVDK